MARTANLIQRRGRWYFNKAYPKELWPVVGASPFRMALNTDALEQAQRMRGHAEQRYWAAVDAARKKLGEVAPRPLSEVEAVAIVSRWFLSRNEDLERGHVHQPTPPEGWQDAVNGNEVGIADTTRRLGMNDIEAFAPLAARVLEAEGIKADPSSVGYRTMLQLLVRANKELSRIDLARLQGDFGYRPADPIFLTALTAPPTPRHCHGADSSGPDVEDVLSRPNGTGIAHLLLHLQSVFGARATLAVQRLLLGGKPPHLVGANQYNLLFELIVYTPQGVGELVPPPR